MSEPLAVREMRRRMNHEPSGVVSVTWVSEEIRDILSHIDHLVAQLAEVTRERDTLVRAIDEAMVNAHLGVFNTGDDPKTAINQLMVWSQDVGAYVADQERDTLAQIVERVRGVCKTPKTFYDYEGQPVAERVVDVDDILRALTPTREEAPALEMNLTDYEYDGTT